MANGFRPGAAHVAGRGSSDHATTDSMPNDELETLISTLTKIGDTVGAEKYKTILEKRRHTTAELPVSQQVSRAFNILRSTERKLAQAVGQFDEMEKALELHRVHIQALNTDLQDAENKHRALVHRLHADTVRVPPGPAKLCIRSILDGTLEDLPIELGDVLGIADLEGAELCEEDRKQGEALVKTLKQSLREQTKALFSAAIQRAETIKTDHKDLLARLAKKKRRTDEGAAPGVNPGGGDGTPPTQAGGPPPASGEPAPQASPAPETGASGCSTDGLEAQGANLRSRAATIGKGSGKAAADPPEDESHL